MSTQEISVAQMMADRIAAEVHLAHQRGESRLVKVSSLMHMFRRPGHPLRIQELVRSLGQRGVEVDCPWRSPAGEMVIRRQGLLQLSGAPHDVGSRLDGDPTIQVSVWSQSTGMAPERPFCGDERQADDDVLWFTIDPPTHEETWPMTSPTARPHDYAGVVDGVLSCRVE